MTPKEAPSPQLCFGRLTDRGKPMVYTAGSHRKASSLRSEKSAHGIGKINNPRQDQSSSRLVSGHRPLAVSCILPYSGSKQSLPPSRLL